jgi:hypothetical protein
MDAQKKKTWTREEARQQAALFGDALQQITLTVSDWWRQHLPIDLFIARLRARVCP